MSHVLSVDLETLTHAQAELLSGFLLAFSKGTANGFLEDEKETAPNNPAAAFGTISEAGPTLTIPLEPTVPVPGGESAVTDKDGIPWDGRIHSSSKALNQDGTWRVKRGTDANLVSAVTAELKKVMAIPSPGPQLVPPPPPAPATAPPPPPANNETTRDNYIALFGRVSKAIAEGKISNDQLNKCLTAIGVPNMSVLGARLDLVPNACALIDGIIAGASA